MDWLDGEEFFNAMQDYRCAPFENQAAVCSAYEAVKSMIRNHHAEMLNDLTRLIEIRLGWKQEAFYVAYTVNRLNEGRIILEYPDYLDSTSEAVCIARDLCREETGLPVVSLR